MKLNIFARLNKLEELLALKEVQLANLQSSFGHLQEAVMYQGLALNDLNRKREPAVVVPTPVTEVKAEESQKDQAKRKLSDAKQRQKTSQKVYYWKNRDKLLDYSREYYQKRKAERAAKVQS